MLGTDPVVARFLAPVPANWELLPFGAMDVREFLASLDAYAFFHHPRWVEAFGRTVIEAMAAGLPVLLPQQFEPLFGDAARYAEPMETSLVLREWLDGADSAHGAGRARPGCRCRPVLARAPRRSGSRADRAAVRAAASAAHPAARRSVLHLQRRRARPCHAGAGHGQALRARDRAGVRDAVAGGEADRGVGIRGRISAVPRLSRRRRRTAGTTISRTELGEMVRLLRSAGHRVRWQHALFRAGQGHAGSRAGLDRLGPTRLLARRQRIDGAGARERLRRGDRARGPRRAGRPRADDQAAQPDDPGRPDQAARRGRAADAGGGAPRPGSAARRLLRPDPARRRQQFRLQRGPGADPGSARDDPGVRGGDARFADRLRRRLRSRADCGSCGSSPPAAICTRSTAW